MGMAKMQHQNGHHCGSSLLSNNHTCPNATKEAEDMDAAYDDPCGMVMDSFENYDFPQEWYQMNQTCWNMGGCLWWNGTGTDHCAGGYCYSDKYTNPADFGCA